MPENYVEKVKRELLVHTGSVFLADHLHSVIYYRAAIERHPHQDDLGAIGGDKLLELAESIRDDPITDRLYGEGKIKNYAQLTAAIKVVRGWEIARAKFTQPNKPELQGNSFTTLLSRSLSELKKQGKI